MRHYPDVFPHDYAAGMCASLAHKLWRASAMSYQDYVRYCNFASKLLGRNLRHLDIQIAYDLAIDVGPTMPEGHERQQESAHIKRTCPDLPIPRPRYWPEAKHPQTSSQRFLRRFNAGDTLADTNTTSRAMKNPPFPAHQHALPLPQGDTVSVSPNGERAAPASQGPTDVSRSPFGETETVLPPGTTVSGSSCFGFPPAYVPSPKVGGFSFSSPAPTQLVLLELQGDLFLSDSSDLDRPGVSLDLVPGTRFRTLSGLVFRVAVLVTPPLSPMGGTFPQKPLYARTVKRGSDAS